MSSARTLSFLIYPGFQLLDLSGPLAVFSGANTALGRTAYAFNIVAEQTGPVVASCGLSVTATHSYADAQSGLAATDTWFALGGEAPEIEAELARGLITPLLRAAHGTAARLASVCTGAFFLAEAGCLAGRRATTHWWSSDRLARRFPAIEVDGDAIFIQSGRIWTSAGVTAGIDLALALVEQDHGRDAALLIARHLVVPRMRHGGQSQYSSDLAVQHTQERRLTGLADAVRAHPDKRWTVDALAQRAGVSRRTLSRLCRDELETSPAGLVESIRLDAARQALVETDLAVERIAEQSGFGSAQRMDRVFGRRLGLAPRAFRSRFRSPFAQETSR
ncbi:GlxA family transcriptional regulator [Maricaulis sp.]|uniref:GlxA family transcriptional regulator n=1 Tax=Maricaulis sp. TaxID=1486257 RepID=UPI002609FC96|nr:GlxA family transcriptional regulator [Maricaulis sp.]